MNKKKNKNKNIFFFHHSQNFFSENIFYEQKIFLSYEKFFINIKIFFLSSKISFLRVDDPHLNEKKNFYERFNEKNFVIHSTLAQDYRRSRNYLREHNSFFVISHDFSAHSKNARKSVIFGMCKKGSKMVFLGGWRHY